MAGSVTVEVGGSLLGVAGDGTGVFTAITTGGRTTIARRDATGKPAWQTPLAGTGGALALARTTVAAALSGTGTVAELAVRGAPGAVVIALDPGTGAARWKLAIDASEWSLINAIAPLGDDFVVGGAFAGTLRAKQHVVSSAGKTDGFVARITAAGEVAWLVRVGGANADAVHGVAAAGERIAIAGTHAPGAELFGEPLAIVDEKSPRSDVFVAELTAAGTRKWQAAFGGPLDDSVAGIAIDGKGRIAVATTVRERLRIGHADIAVAGPADGLVTFFTPDGTADRSVQLGGYDLDGVRAITASGDRVIVGGFFKGGIVLGRETIKASGSDDAYLAAVDGGEVVAVWPITGTGREEITALAPVPGGFVAGIAHTSSAVVDSQPLPWPPDPLTGAAVIVRGVR